MPPSDPDWPFTDDDITQAAVRLNKDRGLALLVQCAERYQITVAEVRRKLKKDAAFKEDVLLWVGLYRLRRGIEAKAAIESSSPKIAVPNGPGLRVH